TTWFDSSMRQYYREWKFKHPYPADFEASLEKASGKDLSRIFMQRFSTGPIPIEKSKALKPTLLFNLKNTEKYNYITFMPAAGYNYYDKVMLGAMMHNYQLPATAFRFLAGALYATGSKELNTFGRAGYTKYNKNSQLNTSLSYINYTKDNFAFSNETINQRVRRIVPSVTYKWQDKDLLSKRQYSLQWKTFLLKEDDLNFSQDIIGPDTFDVVKALPVNSFINRLTLTVSDSRVLYPYNISLTADQGKNFIRTGLTAKYFFNYNEKKEGLSARFFAGKFFHLNTDNSSRFRNERYFLNMTGPSGREDYTYSDYFIGRNEFSGWTSQQIMERDGFFKVRTEMREVGQSDDWLTSLNLVTDLPASVNPLSILPVKIPFKIFLDVGTYAEAWKENPATGRFIYDAGIQLPLFGSTVNVFIPIIYSKVFRDYYKSIVSEKIFLRSISFNVNLNRFQSAVNTLGIPL
ncbi:MAG: family metallopeptidase, partial [Segetibacter sp.]|nr:family metallopeptidase [Segetibacter sp.]